MSAVQTTPLPASLLPLLVVNECAQIAWRHQVRAGAAWCVEEAGRVRVQIFNPAAGGSDDAR